MFILKEQLAIHQRQLMARTDSAVLPHEELLSLKRSFFIRKWMHASPTSTKRMPLLSSKAEARPRPRRPLPKKPPMFSSGLVLPCGALTVLGVAYAGIYRYGERSWRFRVDSAIKSKLPARKM